MRRREHGLFKGRQRHLPVTLPERHGAHGSRDQVGGEGVQVSFDSRLQGDAVGRGGQWKGRTIQLAGRN